MKLLKAKITLGLVLLAGSLASACFTDGYYKVCPGDRVVSSDNYTGTVIGVNSYRQQVVLDLDSYSTNYTYSVKEIYVTSGCVLNLCVGDQVVSSDNYKGRVIGINPFNQKVVIDLDSYSTHYSYSIDQVFSGLDCVADVCVGDDVVSPDNYKGRVIGVNPFSGQVSVDLYSYSTHYSYYYADLFVTNNCIDYDNNYRQRSSRRGLVRVGNYPSSLSSRRLF